MSKKTKCCATCGNALQGLRYDCACGCGKSWCGFHGRKRKKAETPGQESHLVLVVPENAP